MSCKLQTMLVSTVNRLVSKHVSKNTTYIVKQNFCCSNGLWSKSRTIPVKSTWYCSVLYESRLNFHATKADASKGNEDPGKSQELIYYGRITSRIKGLKVVSYSSSLLGIALQPLIIDNVLAMGATAMTALVTVMGFFTFVTPLLIHTCTKNYITEIMYDRSSDVYMSKTLTFFLKDKIERFKLDDINFKDSGGTFNTCTIKGKPYLLFEEGFFDKEHYIKFLGFDKPIDLKMGDESEMNSVKSSNQK